MENAISCPCRHLDCERHGNCRLCREHHEEKGRPVACDRMRLKEERKEKRRNRHSNAS